MAGGLAQLREVALGLGDVGGFEIFLETELAGLRSHVGMTPREGSKGKAKCEAGAGVGWWEWGQ